MHANEFSQLRSMLGKSRKELAVMLGVSAKAVESYEQGWRRIPVQTARMVYFLLFTLKSRRLTDASPCWQQRSCSHAARSDCPAWEAQEGIICWFITGKLCAAAKDTALGGDEYCFSCRVFTAQLEKVKTGPEQD